MEGKKESQMTSKFEVLQPGEKFEMENLPVLVGGRASKVPGYDVYQIKGLEQNEFVSRFGVQVREENGQIIVSRPKLSLNGEAYLATNKIIILNTRGQRVEVQDEYNSGYGNSIYKIFVGDQGVKNGFILEMVGSRALRLNAISDNGKETKWVSE